MCFGKVVLKANMSHNMKVIITAIEANTDIMFPRSKKPQVEKLNLLTVRKPTDR